MTIQITDNIILDDQTKSLFSEPLRGCPQCANVKLARMSTAVWRRYIATWKITEQKLFLINIDAKLETGERVSVNTLFSDPSGEVLADWFTGVLTVPQGRLLKQGIVGYDNIHEETLLIKICKGEVIAIEKQKNEVEAPTITVEVSRLTEPDYLEIPEFLRKPRY